MSATQPVIDVRRVRAELTHGLRHRVLRPHQTLAEMDYDGDEDATTLHLAAFCPASAAEPAGVVTFNRAGLPIDPRPGDYRLRGMAVDAAWQGRGVGKALVLHGLQAVGEAGGRRVWCNARLTATGFYERLGMHAVGQTFDIAGIGGHIRMLRSVRTSG